MLSSCALLGPTRWNIHASSCRLDWAPNFREWPSSAYSNVGPIDWKLCQHKVSLECEWDDIWWSCWWYNFLLDWKRIAHRPNLPKAQKASTKIDASGPVCINPSNIYNLHDVWFIAAWTRSLVEGTDDLCNAMLEQRRQLTDYWNVTQHQDWINIVQDYSIYWL